MIERLPAPPSAAVLRELAALKARAYAATGIRPWTAGEIGASAASPHVHLIVARDRGGAIRGFLCLRLIDGEGEILCLAVDPDHRRRGIARRLFDRVKNDDEVLHMDRLVLEVAETNVQAIAFYRMLGFVNIGTRSGYYRIDGNRVDARFMEKR